MMDRNAGGQLRGASPSRARRVGTRPTLDRPARGAYDYNVPLHPKGGENMHNIIDFCLAVFGSVLGRLIWEWLEGVLHDADNEQRH